MRRKSRVDAGRAYGLIAPRLALRAGSFANVRARSITGSSSWDAGMIPAPERSLGWLLLSDVAGKVEFATARRRSRAPFPSARDRVDVVPDRFHDWRSSSTR